jgi:excisionase family DNA binding protein
MDIDYKKILTVEQAAERLQVTPRTVYEWLRSGKIPGRKLGKVWRMSEEAILEFLGGTPRQALDVSTQQDGESPEKTQVRRVA